MNRRHRARTGRRLLPVLLAGVVGLATVAGMTPPAGAATTAAAAGPGTDASLTATAVAVGTAGPQPGTYTGPGFDACTAPSSAAMRAWLASPYRAVGIYFGGANRACAQPNLTAAWVTEQQAAGWHLMPIYLGSQAPCSLSSKRYLIDPANAAAQGRAQAEDAVAQAKAIGLARQSVLIFDMEAYRTGDAGCRTAVLSFMSAWTVRLHDLGYLSGFYSSMASGVADQVAAYDQAGYVRPDFLDFARWDGVATVDDPAIPSTYWAPKRRMKQYRGDHNETWGGVTINIDSNYLDVALPQPPAPVPGDFTGDGWPDLVARQTSNGSLYGYPGNGTSLTGRSVVGTGWNGMDAIIRTDFTGDGREDVIARVKSTGEAWLYPRTASGWGARTRIGTGWNILREITPAGDFNRDGNRDLLAVQTSTGNLYLYPGRGTGFGTRTVVGSGWNGMDELAGVGDFNRDGYPDLIARQKSNGNLYLYPGRGTRFGPRVQVGSGWNGLRDLVGVGDFNDDGYPDLIAVEKSTNSLYLYRGKGTGFLSRVRLGTGWSGMQPLL
ncbi:DUF1906 domain-containing protein [Micromonospora sp. PLK6-60]|uniref:glycoside hydrolase domain-containing protein n=1 Tax=Micromonospora sp. PLK6-60 TaxID=2873383 RepID=UPI001CA7A42B|nr:glycoside hydrolase domain-containing protein [Micromonospora sp. PLK6-60]MBY8873529.1 DUF1906 domain-containing protein [Micromonospora sp. PLK6-60]